MSPQKQFVPPANLAELLVLEPKLIVRLVAKDRRVPFANKEDCEQAVLLQMLKKHTVERYDVTRRGGIGGARLFYHYAVKCIRNEITTWVLRERQDATNHVRTLRTYNRHDKTCVLADFIDDIKTNITDRKHDQAVISQYYREFERYVRKHKPDLIPALADWLDGYSSRECGADRARAQLRRLFGRFARPKQTSKLSK